METTFADGLYESLQAKSLTSVDISIEQGSTLINLGLRAKDASVLDNGNSQATPLPSQSIPSLCQVR
jgi:hypothetical protein